MNKAVAIIEMPDCCCNCKILGDYGDCGLVEEYVDITKKHNNCPLRPYKDFIPIEWIRDYIMTMYCTEYDNPQLKGIERLLEDWEKENEQSSISY